MHIHILGICGTFMGGIAALAKQSGFRVSGCDSNVYPPMSDQLQALGIELIEGWSMDQLALHPDVWVVGNVVTRGNPLMEAILNQRLNYESGPQWLARHVLHPRKTIAVAGTHGKTTTSAMLTWILQDNDLEPGYLIGGVAENFSYSANLGRGDWFVIEADEYDSAFFDKRSKFLHYRSHIAILNNLEFDHADIFADLAAIETQFHHWVRTIAQNACIIAPSPDMTSASAITRVLHRGCWSEVQYFGVGSDWVAHGSGHHLEIYQGSHLVAEIDWPLLGQHNRQNALAALLAAHKAGVDPIKAIHSLKRFKGVKRRMQLRGEVNGIKVFDDFAHHPTAMQTTLEGVREQFPDQRIIAVFEPRSNTMRLGSVAAQLPAALQVADVVCCYGEKLAWDASSVLAPLANKAHVFTQMDTLLHFLVSEAHCNDLILIMSNGGFDNIHHKLLLALQPKNSNGVTQFSNS